MEAVFARIKDGDERAFERVFRAFYRPLCDYAVTLLGSAEDAEDVVQDLFTRVWAERQGMEVQESVKSYLFTAVRFRALNMLKRRAMEQKHSTSLAEFIEDLQHEDYSEEEMRRIERLQEALRALPPQCRTVFTMSCLDGKTYAEIAGELGITVNTVKSHVAKAYRDLRVAAEQGVKPVLYFIALQGMRLGERAEED